MEVQEFLDTYCETQESTPEKLAETLKSLDEEFSPKGFFMGECQVFDSSQLGSRTILPYGGKATYQEMPDHVYSPRGLASDTSVRIGDISVEQLREYLGGRAVE